VRHQFDVIVSGAGPAGLAVATTAASNGLATLALERRALPIDKACGEGILPRGVRVLEAMSLRRRLPGAAPFGAIAYFNEDGAAMEAALPRPGGLGIRRFELSQVLVETAQAAGVMVLERCAVRGHARSPHGVEVFSEAGTFQASVLVGADGLDSPIRGREGLDGRSVGLRRFGVRQRFATRYVPSRVEVHFAGVVEAYLTPIGHGQVALAFLWREGALDRAVPSQLLMRFPELAARLGPIEPTSSIRGAGPFWRRARACVRDRLVLVGDAAGYVDALTGEGVSLGLVAGRLLGDLLPRALVRGASCAALADYARAHDALFRRYAWPTRALLALAERPGLRSALVHFFARRPRAFERVLAVVTA
jgi:flavin-dependent dehydrogenase